MTKKRSKSSKRTTQTKVQTNRVSTQQRSQTALFQAQGMHCASCAIVIERKLKKLEGVQDVRVNSYTGKVELVGAPTPSLADLNNAVKTNGYTLLRWKGR